MNLANRWLLVVVLAVFSTLSIADGLTEKGLKRIMRAKILLAQGIASNQIIVAAVKEQNAQALPLSTIKAIDLDWRNDNGLTPLKLGYQTNPPGSLLKTIVQTNIKIFSEIFVTDNRGANVAAYPATSDYWQGDETKWTKTWSEGKGDVYLSQVEFDDSSQAHAIQIGVPVKDGQQVVGVLITGIKLTHVQSSYLLRNLDSRLIKR